jgi:multiple sugar transport system ATP-binding protein
MMTKLELNKVTKVFGEMDPVVAVEDLSLQVAEGEFLVLVGPSGCGKSTTLRMIAGLEGITEGEIRLGDRRLNDIPAKDRDIAMVFQSYALYPHMKVRENIAFGLQESTELPDEEIHDRVGRTAETMGISDLLDRRPGALSGGQQQRVALGRAIVRDPAVFLMDEPLSNLDAKLRAEMRTELQQLQDDLGVTTVYVTHDQTEAMTMGDRIAVLNDGRLQQAGTPLECYHEPNNLFVAGFIGEPSMNFFEMTVQEEELVNNRFRYKLSSRRRDQLDGADRVTLGVRPEDIDIRSDLETDHDFRAEVGVVEPKGAENTVHLRFVGSPDDDTFTATTDGMITLGTEEEVIVRFPEDSIHVFDGETGRALFNRSIRSLDETDMRA